MHNKVVTAILGTKFRQLLKHVMKFSLINIQYIQVGWIRNTVWQVWCVAPLVFWRNIWWQNTCPWVYMVLTTAFHKPFLFAFTFYRGVWQNFHFIFQKPFNLVSRLNSTNPQPLHPVTKAATTAAKSTGTFIEPHRVATMPVAMVTDLATARTNIATTAA